jgi:hypothetical protein
MPDWIGYLVLGLVAGFASGCFGIGGGILMVPAFILLFGLNYHVAVATSLALILPISIAGVAVNWKLGNVNWNAFWSCGLAGMAGAVLGVLAIQQINALMAKRLFAVFLIYSAWRLLTATK